MTEPLLTSKAEDNDVYDFGGNNVEMEADPFVRKSSRGGGSHYKKHFALHYELIFWIVWGGLTLWAVVDRFTSNLFPMTINFPPLTTAFGNTAGTTVTIPGSVEFFDNLGRASGRLFLQSCNALFWTQCKTAENFLMEHHPSWVDMGDVRTSHNKIHYIMGVFFMAIPMLIHVTMAAIPAMAGVDVVVSELRPPTRVTPFVWENNGVAAIFLSFDDVFRMALMVVLFAMVFPFTMSNYARRKWFGPTQWIHLAAAAAFTVDQIRRSPHAQVFTVPVVGFWIVDRVLGLWFYRTGSASIIHKELLDSEYMVVFLYVPKQKRQRAVGSTYYLAFAGMEGVFDIAHPYIAFQNHTGEPLSEAWRNRDASAQSHKFYIERGAGERKAFNRRASLRLDEREKQEQLEKMDHLLETGGVASETDDVVFFSNWNTAIVIQVHEWNRGQQSFTSRLSRKPLASRMKFWGPYLSEYGDLTPDGRSNPPLILLATGSGCGPILDYYMHFTANNEPLVNPVAVYYSTNSVGLFQFVTDLLCAKSIPNWTVNAHLTQADDFEADFEKDARPRDSHSSTREMKLGRLSFAEVLMDAPKDASVYFCGAASLQWKVQVACARLGLNYHPGHRFSSEGRISCHRVGGAKFTY